jgi:hypothetical protein
VLVEGGVEDVELRARSGVAYMPRAVAIEFEVRVHADDFERAQLVLRDHAEEIGPAAIREAGESEPPNEPLRQRNARALFFGAAVLLIAVLVAHHFAH